MEKYIIFGMRSMCMGGWVGACVCVCVWKETKYMYRSFDVTISQVNLTEQFLGDYTNCLSENIGRIGLPKHPKIHYYLIIS